MIRGGFYQVNLGRPRDHEQGGKRLGLMMSPSASPLSVVTIIPTSTSAGRSIHRPELEIAGQPARVLIDQIRSIDIDYVTGDSIDYVSRYELAEVELALTRYLGVQRPARGDPDRAFIWRRPRTSVRNCLNSAQWVQLVEHCHLISV